MAEPSHAIHVDFTSFLCIPDDGWVSKRRGSKRRLVERLDHGVLVRRVDGAGPHALAETEDGLNDGQLRGSGVKT